MIDREKVTYGLRCMCYGDVECKECPYARNGSGWHDCRSNCAKDALAMLKDEKEYCNNCAESAIKTTVELQEEITRLRSLLKEQDVKPMIENETGWNCPSCGMNLIGKTASGYPCDLIDLPEDEPIHFCPKCGQAVKWE